MFSVRRTSTLASFTTLIGWAGLVLVLGLAAPLAQAAEPEVTLRLYDSVRLPPSTAAAMRAAASSVLARSGIAVRWARCAAADAPRPARCDEAPDPFEIVVRLVERHETGAPRHCGFAWPTAAGRGSISIARACATSTLAALERTLGRGDVASEAEILGYALAHEVAHVLLPGAPHSSNGVFRASLERRHWRLLRAGRLCFTARDAARLRAAAARRPQAD